MRNFPSGPAKVFKKDSSPVTDYAGPHKQETANAKTCHEQAGKQSIDLFQNFSRMGEAIVTQIF